MVNSLTKTWLSSFIAFIIFSLLFSSSAIAQTKSNKGKEFWLGFMAHEEGTTARMSLYITSDSNASGTVSIPGQSWSTTFTVTANNRTTVNIPSGNAYVNCSDCIQARAVKITSDKDVIAYAHHYMDNQSDATLVLPTKTLGKEYYTMAYYQSSPGNSGRSEFMVVAHKDSTVVRITPSVDINSPSGTKSSGTPYQITLDEGEVYQGQGNGGGSTYDITGTKIEVIDTGATSNCRTVAVFSGSSYTRIGTCSGWGFNSGDNLLEQMFPLNSLGSKFALLPSLGRTSGDNFRILAAEDNTPVYVYAGGFPTQVTLNKAQFLSVDDVTGPQYVLAFKPVMVAKFQKTAKCDGGGNNTGDPSMTIINPLEQTLKDITLYSSSDYDIDNHYIDVTIPTGAISTFTIDGNSIAASNWSTIPNLGGWSYTRITVNAGNHRLIAQSGFIATAYGEGAYESYGYAAGANVRDLRATIDVANSPLGNGGGVDYSGCLGTATEFEGNAEYAVTKWEWFFGDGSTDTVQNPLHTYADTGSYQVKLYTYKQLFDGCSTYDSTFVNISIYGVPTASFGSTPTCDSVRVFFNDTSLIPSPEEHNFTKWTWFDGTVFYGRTPSKVFDTTGNIFVSMEVGTKNQCKDTISDSLFIAPIPVSSFIVNNACFSDSSYFTSTATVAAGGIDSFKWEFSDGTGTLIENPVHYFSTAGTHYATLSLVSEFGCRHDYSDSLTKLDSMSVAFSFNDTCMGNGNDFINLSYLGGGMFTDTVWYTSELDTFGTYNLSKTFNAPGTYAVALIMEQDSFCRDTMLQFVDINPNVVPNFNAVGFCANDSTTFTDQSTLAFGNYTASWDFDDGLTGNGSPVKVKYSSEGTKNVQLTTTTDAGCVTDTTISFEFTNPQIVSLNVNDQCLNESQVIGASLSLGGDTFSSYYWDVNSSTVFIDSSFTFTPTSTGKTVIELTATTNNGCSLYAIDSFNVLNAPVADFSVTGVCEGRDLTPMDLSSSPAPSTLVAHNWFLDGNAVSSAQNPTISGAAVGPRTVRLIVESNIGCRDTADKQVDIYEIPTVDFTASNQCFGDITTLNHNASVGDGTLSYFRWDYDGTSTTGGTVNYTFGSVTSYPIQLLVRSSNGCEDSTTKNIDIHPLPVIDATFNNLQGCEPYNVDITNNSSVATGSIANSVWVWGDGNQSTGAVPGHTYQNTGSYSVKAIMTTDQGCIDSLTFGQTITVLARPQADFTFLPEKPNAYTDTVVIYDESSTDVIDWEYQISDGSVFYTPNASHTFLDTGSYTITQYVENANGCRDSVTRVIFVDVNLFVHIPTAFSPDGNDINDYFGLGGLTQGVVGMELFIYNRWGEKVFESYSPTDKWDGTYQGEPVPQGVYVYRLRYTNPTQSKWFYHNGEIHLMR